MNDRANLRTLFPGRFAVLILASAIGIPAWTQQLQPAADSQTTPPSAEQAQPSPEAAPVVPPAREGFWGRVNPFARKTWVKKQTDPINDRLTELDEVNGKNARDIQNVDSRAQAGIHRAQSTADEANQTATAAGSQARNANGIAQGASSRVDRLNSTVSGLDQYRQIGEIEVEFRSGLPVLSPAARRQLDDLAAGLTGKQGYILDIEAHSPHAGSAGIQTSEHLAEAVKRYLVTEHRIPVYRVHSVALGNAGVAAAGEQASKPVRSSSVQIRLMENTLAAQAAVPPQGAAASTGAERP